MTNISLLYPVGERAMADANQDTTFVEDLNLRTLARRLSWRAGYETHLLGILREMPTSPAIIQYRQEILQDISANPSLQSSLADVLTQIEDLEGYLAIPQWQTQGLKQVAWRLSELESYTGCMLRLHSALSQAQPTLQSAGLRQLHQAISATIAESTFQELLDELPQLLPRIRAIRSITIGINLDNEMRPISAILLDAHDQSFAMRSAFGRVLRALGIESASDESYAGTLHDARTLPNGAQNFRVELEDRNSPFMPALFRDLSILMDETCQPISQAIRKYNRMTSRFLLSLRQDIAFYLGIARFIQQFQEAGLPLCFPQTASSEIRITRISRLYNPILALQHLSQTKDQATVASNLIANDALFDDEGRIYILTGPNQGGKTTYTQAVGLAHVMYQAGLPVPGTEAIISPVDQILTHFAAEERPELEAGRLGEEARRLHGIFQLATRHSLVLMNESLASTNATESVYIARDVLRVLRRLGVRSIFATHLHGLAEDCDALNQETEGTSRIVSLVSQVIVEADGKTIRRTYHIAPGPPLSRSYAIELAAQYGISYDQLIALLKARGTLDDA